MDIMRHGQELGRWQTLNPSIYCSLVTPREWRKNKNPANKDKCGKNNDGSGFGVDLNRWHTCKTNFLY